MEEEIMRTAAFLAQAIVIATLVSHPASADIKRHQFVPEALRGSWAPSADACQKADKSVIVVSAETYASAGTNCMVAFVSETPSARGAIYSAHLLCAKPGDKAAKTSSDVIFTLKDDNQISMGSRFSALKSYQRCAANEPAATQ
jgi:hypothetical protein